MTKVFIGGSRQFKQLPTSVLSRLDNIVSKGLSVLLGDANGADKAVQQYFAKHHYQQVVIYCSSGTCRNNLGGWPIQAIPADTKSRGFDFYAAKDAAMAKDADYGLMLWDGESNGTLNNVLNLLGDGKKTVVYLAPENDFYTIREADDLTGLLGKCDPQVLKKFESKINLSRRLAA
jgi:hypothetical protein